MATLPPRKKLLSIFERHASTSTELTYLMYSATAEKKYGAYKAKIPDGQGGLRSITYTSNVPSPDSYYWDDKQVVAACQLRELQDVQVSKGDSILDKYRVQRTVP